MRSGQRGLVVFLGQDALRGIFAHWPKSMNVAICCREDGECSMIVFHDGEGVRVIPRVKRIFGPSVSEVASFPEVSGFSTRKLLFSEEREIHSIVRNAPELVEEAQDYSANYVYALEEGLDPVRFLHGGRKGVVRKSGAIMRRQEETLSQQVVRKNTHTQPAPRSTVQAQSSCELPSFLKKGASIDAKFVRHASRPLPVRGCVRIVGVVFADSPGVFRIELRGCEGPDWVVDGAHQVFVRDDRKVVALQLDGLKVDTRELPSRIWISPAVSMKRVEMLLSKNLGAAQLSCSEEFIQLHFKDSDESVKGLFKEHVSNAESAGLLSRRNGLLSWQFWASACTVVASLMILLQVFLLPSFAQQSESSIDWGRYQISLSSEESVSRAVPFKFQIFRFGG